MSTDAKKLDLVTQYLRFCSNIIIKNNFSSWFQQTKFLANWLGFHEVMDYIKLSTFVVNNAKQMLW